MAKALVFAFLLLSSPGSGDCLQVLSAPMLSLFNGKLETSVVKNVYERDSWGIFLTFKMIEQFGPERTQFLLDLLEVPEPEWTAEKLASVKRHIEQTFSATDAPLAWGMIGLQDRKEGDRSPIVPLLMRSPLARFFWPDHGFQHLTDILENLQNIASLVPRFAKYKTRYAFLFDQSEGAKSWGHQLFAAALLHDAWSVINRKTHAEMALPLANPLLSEFSTGDNPFLSLESPRDWVIPAVTALLHSKSMIPAEHLPQWRSLLLGQTSQVGFSISPNIRNMLERSLAIGEVKSFTREDETRIEAMAELLRMADGLRPRGPYRSWEHRGLVNSGGIPFQIDPNDRVYLVAGRPPFRVNPFGDREHYLFAQVALGNPVFEENGEQLSIHFPVYHWSPRAMALAGPLIEDRQFLKNIRSPEWLETQVAKVSKEYGPAGSLLFNVADILLEFPPFLIEGGTVDFIGG